MCIFVESVDENKNKCAYIYYRHSFMSDYDAEHRKT